MPESSTSTRRRSEISEALDESFASIDVDAAGKKSAADAVKPRIVREDREEEDEDAATEDWSYKVCSALPIKTYCSERKHLPRTFQIPEPPSGFKDDSVIPKKAESPSSSSSSTSGHESPITVGETKPVLSQQEQQQQAAVAASHDSGTELSSDKSEDKPSAEVSTPSPPPATANGNSEADDTYSYCSGRNSLSPVYIQLLYFLSHSINIIFLNTIL